MRRRILIVSLALVVGGLGLTGLAAAEGWGPFGGAIPATARYHDVDKAIADGYALRLPELSGKTCIVQPGEGAMGVHMVNTALLDATIDPQRPEVLVYEPRKHGKLRLVALEYVVFRADWEAAHGAGAAPPRLFGRAFDSVGAPNRYGLPPFYALHAWLWKWNPTGLLSAWNPRVECDGS